MILKAYSLDSKLFSFELIISNKKSINFSSVNSFFITSLLIILFIVFKHSFFLYLSLYICKNLIKVEYPLNLSKYS